LRTRTYLLAGFTAKDSTTRLRVLRAKAVCGIPTACTLGRLRMADGTLRQGHRAATRTATTGTSCVNMTTWFGAGLTTGRRDILRWCMQACGKLLRRLTDAGGGYRANNTGGAFILSAGGARLTPASRCQVLFVPLRCACAYYCTMDTSFMRGLTILTLCYYSQASLSLYPTSPFCHISMSLRLSLPPLYLCICLRTNRYNFKRRPLFAWTAHLA